MENIVERQNELNEKRQVFRKCHEMLGINFFSALTILLFYILGNNNLRRNRNSNRRMQMN
jgi:hypothetical protein